MAATQLLTHARLPLRVDRLSTPQAFASLREEWDELDATLLPRSPFTGGLWNELWWKHYQTKRRIVCDELMLHAVRTTDGKLIGVAPMMLTRRPAVGPLQTRVIQCFGADVNVTELRGLVCRPEDQARVRTAVAASFERDGVDWAWIDWGAARCEDPTNGESTREVADPHTMIPSYYLPLAPTWPAFKSRLSRNIKESLRKCYNSLKRDNLTFDFRVLTEVDQTEAALDTFFHLHRARARAMTGAPHMDVFGVPRDRAFLLDYSQQMAARGQLRVFQLAIGGAVIATRVGFLLGDEVYLYYSGYDVRWAKYSVMTTLVAEAIKWAIGQGLRSVSLSTGRDVSKLRWGPKEAIYRPTLELSPGWRSQLAFRAYHQLFQMRGSDTPLQKLLSAIRR
jgi:CelD/BcsL family acetyltransferase involved in cellulose biosynthesis